MYSEYENKDETVDDYVDENVEAFRKGPWYQSQMEK